MPAEAAQILVPFGFTSLESEVYTYLLQESSATGYRVAQGIGKAAANTYKALDSLQQKGAVLVEDGSTRSYRAVPSNELLARLTRDFEWRRAAAEIALANLGSGDEDDRVYSLRSRSQVIERARHMLASAKRTAILCCSSEVADQIEDSIASAGRRDIEVVVGCSARDEISGVDVRRISTLDELRMVIDESEALLSLFSKGSDEVSQAIWTRSPYLALCIHRGLSAELSTRTQTLSPA